MALEKFLFLIFFTSLTNAMTFSCRFFYVGHGTLGDVYSCQANVTFDGFDHLTAVYGNHSEFKDNSDVEYLMIYYQNLTNIPKGMVTFFPDLKGINFVAVEIHKISAVDLEPLPYLQFLDLAANNISSLDDDLFKFTPHLNTIRLTYNQLKHVGWNTFRNLDNLTKLLLDENPCIDDAVIFPNRENVLKLIERVSIDCPSLEGAPTESTPDQCPADCSYRIEANTEYIRMQSGVIAEQGMAIKNLSESLAEVERKLNELRETIQCC